LIFITSPIGTRVTLRPKGVPMFTVYGETSHGPISSSHHETAQGALDKAVQLMTRLYVNLHIVSPTGRRLTPADLARELDAKPSEDELS
jgi:hypothetical protein